MFGQTGAPQKGAHSPENIDQQQHRDIFWPLYGVLRHLEVHSVQLIKLRNSDSRISNQAIAAHL